MKKMILLTAVALLCVFSNTYSQNGSREIARNEGSPVKVNGPVASFDKTTFEFGTLNQNSPGTASFVLTNTGNEPLIIASATASCGCTNLTWSKDPILPGKTTTISVTYNAAVPGDFGKTVTIRTNATDQPVYLQVKGKVVAKS